MPPGTSVSRGRHHQGSDHDQQVVGDNDHPISNKHVSAYNSTDPRDLSNNTTTEGTLSSPSLNGDGVVGVGVVGSGRTSPSSLRLASASSSTFPGTTTISTTTRFRDGSGRSTNSWTAFGGTITSSSKTSSRRSNPTKEPKMLRTSKSVFVGRYIFILVLLSTSAILGYIAYHLMLNGEKQVVQTRFDSITTRALSVAQLVIEEKKKATDSLALMVGISNPNANEWPFVYMDGYKQVAQSLGIVTEGSLSLCPIVTPGGIQQTQFEQFAYKYYSQIEYPTYFPTTPTATTTVEADTTSNTTIIPAAVRADPDSGLLPPGYSEFGFGIFSYGNGPFGNLSYTDGRFHIQSNYTYYNSQHNILVPYFQSDYDDPNPVLLLNVHFEHHRGHAIDNTIQCSNERATTKDYTRECSSITDLMWSETNAKDVIAGPAGLYMVPIYPKNDNTTLTGFIVGKQIWADLLKHGFEKDVSGLIIVLRTSSGSSHTYKVEKGEVIYVGPGSTTQIDDEDGGEDDDHAMKHDFFYSATAHINPNYFSNTTVEYYMDIYSTQEFTNIYTTRNPFIACVGTVCTILGTALLFLAYDYFVRREFHSKKKLLHAKRQFVRFVSHEVRTPLNTVCMGLTLLQHDLKAVLGKYDDTTDTNSSSNGGNDMSSVDEKEQLINLKDVQEWTELTHQIYQNADAAVNVMSDLLNYDKVQMGTLTLELSLISIYSAIEKTVSEFKIAAMEQKINLQLDLSPLLLEPNNDVDDDDDEEKARTTTPFGRSKSKAKTDISSLPEKIRTSKVVGDPVRLAQVFRNLISNGLKFSNEGGNLTIRISEKRFKRNRNKEETAMLHTSNQGNLDGGPDNDEEGIKLSRRGHVYIEVIDEGVGMTPEQLRTVFDDGTQFNANKYQAGGGSGLGLNIAKGIVEQHNGKMTCSSMGMGKGTTFRLSLPLYDNPTSVVLNGGVHGIDDETPTTQTGDATTKEIDSDFEIPKLHILVVDDSTTNLKLCMRLLERGGHTCRGACDGKEALDMVQTTLSGVDDQPFDCILMDHEMPVMNGPDSCAAMRKMGCSAYIVGVTGNVMSEDVEHFRESGANWVLPKPFRLEALENCWVEDGVTHFESKQESAVVELSELNPVLRK